MNGLLKYLTGKATAPLNMLVALGFAVFAFVGLPLEATETTPTNGLPDSAEPWCSERHEQQWALQQCRFQNRL